METIEIHKWSETFENADSRKRQRLGLYYMPSGCDSAGYLALMSEFEPADAWQAYGTFVALCQHAATMRREIRGRFVNSNGVPMTTRQIAMLIRCPHDLFLKSLAILVDSRVGWVVCHPSASDVPPICQSHPKNSSIVQGEGEGEGEGQGEGEGEEQATLSPMDDLKKKINALKTEWQKPAAWSYAEEQHLHNGCAKQMAELDADDWEDMKRYFNANLDQAKAFYRPASRGRFCEQFADVFAHMVRWRGKNGKAKKSTPKGDTIWK